MAQRRGNSGVDRSRAIERHTKREPESEKKDSGKMRIDSTRPIRHSCTRTAAAGGCTGANALDFQQAHQQQRRITRQGQEAQKIQVKKRVGGGAN